MVSISKMFRAAALFSSHDCSQGCLPSLHRCLTRTSRGSLSPGQVRFLCLAYRRGDDNTPISRLTLGSPIGGGPQVIPTSGPWRRQHDGATQLRSPETTKGTGEAEEARGETATKTAPERHVEERAARVGSKSPRRFSGDSVTVASRTVAPSDRSDIGRAFDLAHAMKRGAR